MMLVLLALIACGPNEVSDLLDFPEEVVVQADRVECPSGNVFGFDMSFTVEALRDAQIRFEPELELATWQWDVDGESIQYGRVVNDTNGTPLDVGRGDVLDLHVQTYMLCATGSAFPPSEVLPMIITAGRCRWFGEDCDPRREVEGEISIVWSVPD